MKESYKILVLTDHSGHSEQNSIYAILNQMLDHPKSHSIYIASRGFTSNNMFFNELQKDALFGCKVDRDFSYDEGGKSYKNGVTHLNPKDFDLLFLRLPRPISDEFLVWLEKIFNHAVIINRPSGIIETSNKKYLLNIRDVCPEVRLCQSVDAVLEEASKYPIVLKPLKEYGGRGLLKIIGSELDDGDQKHNTVEYLEGIRQQIENDGYLAMRFLKNVSQGDKRILVVGGEILGSSLRLPAEGSWLCNVSQGGKSVATKPTTEEEEIIAKISPKLLEHGVLIFGVDTLVNDDGNRVLSEINTLSIGGFPQAEAQSGQPIIKKTIDKIFEYADRY